MKRGDYGASKTWCAGLIIVLLAGCATQRVSLDPYIYEKEGSRYVLLEKIAYDDYGRPLFSGVLKKRPEGKGGRYTLVHLIEDLPAKSFDIAITGRKKPDMSRPLNVIYEWTGAGFVVGVEIMSNLNFGRDHGWRAESGEEALVLLAAATAPMIAGAVTGFTVGLIASIPSAAEELTHFIINKKETLISYSVYEYDGENRIKRMMTYSPSDPPNELIRTEYYYRDGKAYPYETLVRSFPENTIRTIRKECPPVNVERKNCIVPRPGLLGRERDGSPDHTIIRRGKDGGF